jgi:hypothetical protein
MDESGQMSMQPPQYPDAPVPAPNVPYGGPPQSPEWRGGPPPPYGQPWPGPAPYGPMPGGPRPPVDGFAITSLVLGLLSGVVFSVGFGIAALRRIGRGERRGRGLAIAGLVLSLVWTIVYVGVFAYHSGRKPARDTSGAITRQGQIPPVELRIGDCLRVPRQFTGVIRTLTVVPCAQPHNGQVFTILRAPDGPYPGDVAMQTTALNACKRAAPAFLGTDQSLLHAVAFFPRAAGWSLGDRAERCLLVDREKDITGDIRADK